MCTRLSIDSSFNSIDGSTIPSGCSVVGAEASNPCPASEWYAVRDWLSALMNDPPISFSRRYDVGGDPLLACLVHGQNSARNLLNTEDPGGYVQGVLPTFATTQQAVIADALTQAGVLWFASLINVTANTGHGMPLSDQSDAIHTVSSNYSQPYTTGVCVHGEIGNYSINDTVSFPLIPGVNSPALATANVTDGDGTIGYIRHPELTFPELWETPGDLEGYRLRWVQFPEDLFTGSSIGAAVLLPGPRSRRDFVACNFAALWGSSSLNVENFGGGIGPMGSTYHSHGGDNQPVIPISKSHVPDAESYDPPGATPFDTSYIGSRHGQRTINISEDWAQYLNPAVEGFNTSLLNVLMQYNPGDTASAISTSVVMLMANGLARSGWGSTLQGDLKTVMRNGEESIDGNYWISGKGDVFTVDPAASQDWVTLRMDSALRGYAYNTRTIPPRIAIAILAAYCVLVVGHTIYHGITGKTHMLYLFCPQASVVRDGYGVDTGLQGRLLPWRLRESLWFQSVLTVFSH